MSETIQPEHRQAVLRLIHSHERNISMLERIGLSKSADILRISWLDLIRSLHDISSVELDALGDNVVPIRG
jgi:hypothetical protein